MGSLKLIVDSREKKPYDFTKYGATVERATLPVADYSLPGFQDRVGVERKSLGDLIACLSRERERFERELAKLRCYDLAAVVVECAIDDVRRGSYRSEMQPNAILQSIFAFQIRWKVPFIWAGSRAGGEYVTHGLLSKYRDETAKRYEAMRKAQGMTT